MHQSDLTLLPVHALSAAIQARHLSPVDVVEAYLGRSKTRRSRAAARFGRAARPRVPQRSP
ncbi:MAG: hypothetical protein ACJ8AR_06650, partial [Microvirga sp.]